MHILRPNGRPRTLAERKARHKAKYGNTNVPKRRFKHRVKR